MRLRAISLVPLLALALAGCVKEPAAFLIEGGDHSLTVERNKPYFWSSGWELDLVVTRMPDCQRRHALKKAGDKKFRIDLYRSAQGGYILNQGSRWYVADTRECRMQQFEEEPQQPGELLGSFRVKGGVFGFVPAEQGKNDKGVTE